MIVEDSELMLLVGINKVNTFRKMINEINNLYDMDITWNNGGKRWDYEYKFRKSSKTLCAFYFKKDVMGLMIIFGKDEREKVENIRADLSEDIIKEYDDATTYHDGKWVMFNIIDDQKTTDIIKLLNVKRKPNRK